MQCRFCGGEMTAGALSIEERYAEFNDSPTRYIGLRDSLGRPMRINWFKIRKEAAWCCPDCRKLILDYPEEARERGRTRGSKE